MKRQWPLFLLIGILFAGIGIYFGFLRHGTSVASEAAVERLMAQSFPDAQGRQVQLAQYRGKPVLVNFWATWCPPCVQEMPELDALQKELGPSKLQILGIGIDSASNIADFAAKQKISYPLFVAGMNGTDLSRQLGNSAGGLPFSVLVDAEGRASKQYLGRLKMETLRADLAAL